jgi:hypothetical protein
MKKSGLVLDDIPGEVIWGETSPEEIITGNEKGLCGEICGRRGIKR